MQYGWYVIMAVLCFVLSAGVMVAAVWLFVHWRVWESARFLWSRTNRRFR